MIRLADGTDNFGTAPRPTGPEWIYFH